MRLPPLLVRRPLQVVLLLLVSSLVVCTLPVTVPLAALAAVLPSVRSRALRVLAYAVVLVAVELLGTLAALLLWVGGRARDERFHY